MNLQTYLMIKQSNEDIKRDIGTGLGLKRSPYMERLLAPRGVLLGTAPDGTTFTVDGPPLIKNKNNLQKRISLMLAPLGMGAPLR